MTDIDRAIAAAREALAAADASLQGNAAPSAMLSEHYDACAGCADALRDLLATLDAARGQAVAWVEAGDLEDVAENGYANTTMLAKDARGRAVGLVPLYAAPPAAAVSELVGAMFRHKQSGRTRLVLEDEADDFEAMNATWMRVGAVCLCSASKENTND